LQLLEAVNLGPEARKIVERRVPRKDAETRQLAATRAFARRRIELPTAQSYRKRIRRYCTPPSMKLNAIKQLPGADKLHLPGDELIDPSAPQRQMLPKETQPQP